MKSVITILGFWVVLIIASFIIAPAQVWAKPSINKNAKGLAIKGYDPVAYFTLGKSVKGKNMFEHKWQDAIWRFANEDHLNLFKSNPEKYAPQYGGYWAYAVAMGTIADIDPVEGWKIVDDKLYLNYSREIQKKWSKDIPGYIKNADKNWPDVLD